MKALRIIIAIIGFAGVLFLPPWVPVVCIVLLSLRLRAWEAIFIGAFMDFTWLPSQAFMHLSIHALPLFTIAALLIVWGFEPLRAQFLVSQ
jgi:hypothetical protein